MSKHYYREILGVIKTCKGCGEHWRPGVYDKTRLMLNQCDNCLKPHYKRFYKEYWKPYLESLSPDRRKRLAEQCRKAWAQWVEKNVVKRRAQALASYHRNKNKPKNRKRKHRATRNT